MLSPRKPWKRWKLSWFIVQFLAERSSASAAAQCDYSLVEISEECPSAYGFDWQLYHEQLYLARSAVFSGDRQQSQSAVLQLLDAVTRRFWFAFECPLAVASTYFSLAQNFAFQGRLRRALAFIHMGFIFIRDKGFNECTPWPVQGWDMLLAGRNLVAKVRELDDESVVPTPPEFRLPKHRVAIASICAYGETEPVRLIGCENHRVYAELHGYDLYQVTDKSQIQANFASQMDVQDGKHKPFFWKVNVVKNILEQRPRYDWILWIDCDAFFMDPGRTIDSVIHMYSANTTAASRLGPRLPVLHQSNDWTAPQVEVPPKDQPGDGTLQSAPAALATPGAGSQPVETTHAPTPSNGTAETSQAVAAENTAPITENEEAARRDCLGNGEAPFCGEEAMLRPAAMPGLHVQLFRRLQAKWQCYDAYCRVCMALGVNQILQGLTYYAIVHTLVENRSPSCGYALLVIFQAAALAVAVLDISGLRRRALLAVQAVGTLPATLAALAVHSAERNESGVLDPGEIYYTSPAMFFLQACWLELLLWVAQPSKDDAALPRRFRTVLFLDVFGDGVDPTEAEIRPNLPTSNLGCDQELQSAERVAGAEAALSVAAAAVKRWEAAPRVVLSESQASELTRIRVELQIWRRALKGELAWRAAARGMPHEADLMIDDSIRPWGELSPEQEEDPFRGCLLGPFEHDMGYESSTYFYDPEKVTYVWESPGNRLVLSMASAAAAVRGLEAAMRLLLAMSENAAARTEEPVDMPGPGQDDLDSMLRGVFAVPWKLCAWCQSRLTQLRARVSASASGIELSTPLVQRQNSPQSSHQGRVAHQIAGPHAKHFVPERLPWQVLRGVTRILQLSWSFTGMMAVLRELGIYRIDYQQHPGGDRQLSARRLSSDLSLSFEDVQVEWPHGDFFEAEGISWLATEVFAETSGSTSSTSRGGSMMFSSAFTNYLARGDGRNGPLKLQEFADFLPGVVAVNGPGGVRFLASSSQSEAKLFLWPFHEAAACRGDASRAELSLAGRDAAPWRCMAGTFQHCEANQSHWCLLLAGWDGVRALVAEIHVEDMCVLPAGSVRPSYSVPIEVDATPRAFTFIRRQGSLQLLGLFRSSIQAWDLQAKKALWRSRGWSEDFKALSLAEDAGSSELYVVGWGRIGSRLLKARLT